jgi:hypothetical protein
MTGADPFAAGALAVSAARGGAASATERVAGRSAAGMVRAAAGAGDGTGYTSRSKE